MVYILENFFYIYYTKTHEKSDFAGWDSYIRTVITEIPKNKRNGSYTGFFKNGKYFIDLKLLEDHLSLITHDLTKLKQTELSSNIIIVLSMRKTITYVPF